MTNQAYLLSIAAAGWMTCLLSLPCEAADVKTGDSRQNVKDKLGPPHGTALAGGVDLWIYPQGEIEFQADRVSRVHWISQSEYQAKQQGISLQNLQREQAEESTARALRQQAKMRKREILNDPNYATLTPAEQAAIWDNYYESFPDVKKEPWNTPGKNTQEIEKSIPSQVEPITEAAPVRLSGSKKRKASRGAGKVKPEDRPSFMTRQTLNIKERQEKPNFLSDQKVQIPARQEKPSYLSGQSLNIKSSSANPSFLSDQNPY